MADERVQLTAEFSRIWQEDQENERAIAAYEGAEYHRLDAAVYTPLQEAHPELQPIFAMMKKKSHKPLREMRERGEKLETLERAVRLIDALHVETEGVREIREVYAALQPVIDLYQQYAPLQEQFYLDLSRSIRAVAREKGISIEETVRELPYLDESLRMVFPTRGEAETFRNLSDSYERTASRSLLALIGSSIEPDPANDSEELKAARIFASTPGLYGRLREAVQEYKQRELERVYSRP